ncbi:MAG: ABC transporter permease [Streptosporangiaceae bacterium]|nr:ABC transporter permease [Streptosporangiaceae bacterium]
MREFSSNRLAVVGIGILVFFVLFSFVGPLIYHTDQIDTNDVLANLPPNGSHLLGTDGQGFDELGRIMKGGQAALEIGFFAAAVAIVIGVLWGAVSGLAGGIIDSALMRVVDVFLSVPFLFVVLLLAVKFGATVLSLSLVIGGFAWQVPARLVRGEVLTLRERDFVLAARTAGANSWRLISRHLIPNALGVVIVNVTFQVADAILAVAYVGFLGFGLHYPNVDWGDQLSDASTNLQDGYWWLAFPVGICIVLTVMALNFIGDALRDSMDVRLRRR